MAPPPNGHHQQQQQQQQHQQLWENKRPGVSPPVKRHAWGLIRFCAANVHPCGSVPLPQLAWHCTP
eukprot:5807015-Amphidinium_carterae.1